MNKQLRTVLTMTPEHLRWEEFITRLEGEEGCDFSGDTIEEATWRCKGGTDKSYAIAILNDMNSENCIDIQASLDYFQSNGGHCDCEIVFNVATN